MTPRQHSTFYRLSEEVIKRRFARYDLELKCCICGGTLQIGDNVVRKRRKLYHQTCWENSFLDIPDDILDEEDLRLIEDDSIPTSTSFSITSGSIPFNTIPATITFAVRGSMHPEPITTFDWIIPHIL
jgi:hypothetical protein